MVLGRASSASVAGRDIDRLVEFGYKAQIVERLLSPRPQATRAPSTGADARSWCGTNTPHELHGRNFWHPQAQVHIRVTSGRLSDGDHRLGAAIPRLAHARYQGYRSGGSKRRRQRR